MKMQFHHTGRQFYFITIAIERQSNLAQQGFGGAEAKQSRLAGVGGRGAPLPNPAPGQTRACEGLHGPETRRSDTPTPDQDTQILDAVGSPSWSSEMPKVIDTNNSFTLSHFI